MLRARMGKDGRQQIVHIPSFDSHVHAIISRSSLGSHDMARSLTLNFACDAQSLIVWLTSGAMPSKRREAVSMMSRLYCERKCCLHVLKATCRRILVDTACWWWCWLVLVL